MESGVRKQANNNCDLACIFCVDDDQRSEEISLDTMRGAIHRITSPLLDHSRSKKGNILSSKMFQVFPSHTIYILLDGQMRRMQLGDKVEPSALFFLACCKESPCLYVWHFWIFHPTLVSVCVHCSTSTSVYQVWSNWDSQASVTTEPPKDLYEILLTHNRWHWPLEMEQTCLVWRFSR